MDPTPAPLPASLKAARTRRLAVLQLWLLNIAFGVFLGVRYLHYVPEGEDLGPWFFALPALLSSVFTLTLLPGLLFTLWAPFARSERRLAWMQASVWAFFHVWLYVDTRIFTVFKYHFNGQVVNLIFAKGAEDALYLGWSVYLSVAMGLTGTAIVEALLFRRLVSWNRRAEHLIGMPALARPTLACFAVLVPAVVLEKSIYANAYLDGDAGRSITTLSRLFPLYPRVPLEDLASAVAGDGTPPRPRLELDDVALDYPLQHPRLPADGPRPNVLVIGIDCWRSDMLTPEVTPRLSAFAEDALRFDNHLSGGNSTRFGLFSLIYGLHGSYWFPMLNEQRSPVLVDTLLDAGYEFGVFSSASMDYPELRQTAWVRVADDVRDDFPSEQAWVRDTAAAQACRGWLRRRAKSEQPFFAFLMLDAPHQKYSFPPDHTPFLPIADDVDYMEISRPDGPPPGVIEGVFNRYRNAVHFSDSVAGDVLDLIEELGLAEDTLVFVTGDHGEEFLENGFFGHTSAFSPLQVRVPFLMSGPGIEPGREGRPTQHQDFPATLLELLGADPALRKDWVLGENLLAPLEERRRVLSGWNEMGLWTPSGIFRVSFGDQADFDVQLYDYSWTFQPGDAHALKTEEAALRDLAGECARFLR